MNVARLAALAMLISLGSGASAQTTTECKTVAGVTRCETTPSQQPLDYGATLRAGQDLVPRYTPPPARPEPTPPRDAQATPRRWIETGNDLLAACEREELACFVYIQASIDGFAVAMQITDSPKRLCLPDGVTQGQSADIVMAEMKRSPENRHWPAAAVAMYALIKAFPCPR